MWLFPLILVIFLTGTLCQNTSTFICVDGNVIPTKDLCNGIENCLDGSDEQKHLCYHVICPKNYFRCAYGACIDPSGRCDGTIQCMDRSDEAYCNTSHGCSTKQFMCETGECISLDKLCDGIGDCLDKSDESEENCMEVLCPKNTFRCSHGGCVHLDARCNGVMECVDGSDESENVCWIMKCTGVDCVKARRSIYCPPILAERMVSTCTGPYGKVPCDKPVPVGTVAEYRCKVYYKPTKHTHNTNQAVCQDDGTWNREILKCIPECGMVYSQEIHPRIVNGWEVTPGTWTWHAVIYEHVNDTWIFSCGGSLVSERIVLTAAQCTWGRTKDEFQVALGKYYSSYSDGDTFTQYVNISNILMHPSFQDSNFGSDIALLQLEDPVQFNEFVRPVCLDWSFNEFKHLREDTRGVIFGLGASESEPFSSKLHGAYLPLISTERCMREQRRDYRKFITSSTFCAGWRNGTAICNGDSGGGLAFPSRDDSGRWVLHGIASLQPKKPKSFVCDPNYYTIFTKVSLYANWMRDVIFQVDGD